MMSKALFDAAKAFLCWDVFSDISVQFVPLRGAVAYYYPPGNGLHTITVFYDPAQRDFSEPLFLLFHEAGHSCQWRQMQEKGQGERFSRLMGLDKGAEKVSFEAEAWRAGRQLLERFAERHGLGAGLASRFATYGDRCVRSYDGS